MKNIEEIINRIHLGKWEEVMPQIPDNSVDIVITSPPYNVSLGVGNKLKKDAYDTYEDNMPYEDYLNWMDKLYTECYRVLKTSGRICVNIGDIANGSTPTHADFTIRLRDKHKFIPMTTIVWNKQQIGCSTSWGSYQSPSCPSFPTQFEFIIVMAKETTKHEGDKNDITVGGKEFQRNSRALWSFPPETRMMAEYGHPACVDSQTECLTIDGWKKYNQIKIGDMVASLNMETGLMEWNKNLYTTVYNHDGVSINVNGRHIDMILSPVHRCVVKKDNNYIIKLAKDLCRRDKIPCSANWNVEKLRATRLTNINKDIAYLAGFFLGDGHYKKDKNGKVYNIVIDQSLTANGDKVKTIRNYLINVGAEFKENTRHRIHAYDKTKSSYQVSFCIKGKIRDEIMKLCQYPLKKVPLLYLYWEDNILESFLNGMVDADGHKRGNNKSNLIITQKDNDVLDCFQAIGVRLGYDAFLNRSDGTVGDTGYVELTKKQHKLLRNARSSLLNNKNYNGIMWCPYVENNGTFLARRNGRVFITGNCFPEELPRRLIQQLTYKNDVVLDPFSGAATTCTVAKQLGRKYIGIEMSEKYYKTSLKRLSLTPNTITNVDEKGNEIVTAEWMN